MGPDEEVTLKELNQMSEGEKIPMHLVLRRVQVDLEPYPGQE
eukprot:CAMPEP_0170548590 /NCGR_PEP_ID=MMETSP0211-20121228/6869_1 /TAXON_ID=311385 /ORGANISM="Pseudokeronopsis sp., Strain OXSARD2" /LENGTH=41 /DNA_ID= /DNA_START= /DNA_END= /DNA_ORIENTATION=